MIKEQAEKIRQRCYKHFIEEYCPQKWRFNTKEVILCNCPRCNKPNQLIVWPYIAGEQFHPTRSWAYCIACNQYGNLKELKSSAGRPPYSRMAAFINQSKQNFTDIFFNDQEYYHYALPRDSEELMAKVGLDQPTAQINSHVFNGSIGYCKGSDIIALGKTVRRSTWPRPYQFNANTPCLIFPIARLPGQYVGFIAYCEAVQLEYRTKKHYDRKNRTGEYIYLSVSNKPETYISQSLDECIQDITDYSLVNITIMIDLHPVEVNSSHV